MSFLTGTPAECFWVNDADGTALATFTAEASLLAGMSGNQPILPAGFFLNIQQAKTKTIKLWARGVCGSTTTGPTFTFFLRLNTAANVLSGTSILQSPAITMQASQTNAIWEFEADITCRSMGVGASSATFEGSGLVTSPGFASPFIYGATPAASASVWTATLDASVALYLSLSASCGTSNAANTVQCKFLEVWGVN